MSLNCIGHIYSKSPKIIFNWESFIFAFFPLNLTTIYPKPDSHESSPSGLITSIPFPRLYILLIFHYILHLDYSQTQFSVCIALSRTLTTYINTD